MIPASVLDAMQRALETHPDGEWLPADLRELSRVALEAALATGDVVLARCSCPAGWGNVRDANCPTHGARAPAHTVAGAPPSGASLRACPKCGEPARAVVVAPPLMYEPVLGAGLRPISGSSGPPMLECERGHVYAPSDG